MIHGQVIDAVELYLGNQDQQVEDLQGCSVAPALRVSWSDPANLRTYERPPYGSDSDGAFIGQKLPYDCCSGEVMVAALSDFSQLCRMFGQHKTENEAAVTSTSPDTPSAQRATRSRPSMLRVWALATSAWEGGGGGI